MLLPVISDQYILHCHAHCHQMLMLLLWREFYGSSNHFVEGVFSVVMSFSQYLLKDLLPISFFGFPILLDKQRFLFLGPHYLLYVLMPSSEIPPMVKCQNSRTCHVHSLQYGISISKILVACGVEVHNCFDAQKKDALTHELRKSIVTNILNEEEKKNDRRVQDRGWI